MVEEYIPQKWEHSLIPDFFLFCSPYGNKSSLLLRAPNAEISGSNAGRMDTAR